MGTDPGLCLVGKMALDKCSPMQISARFLKSTKTAIPSLVEGGRMSHVEMSTQLLAGDVIGPAIPEERGVHLHFETEALKGRGALRAYGVYPKGHA